MMFLEPDDFDRMLRSRATLMAEKEKVDASFADRLFVNRTREVRQYLKDYKRELIDERGGVRYWQAYGLVEMTLREHDPNHVPDVSIG